MTYLSKLKSLKAADLRKWFSQSKGVTLVALLLWLFFISDALLNGMSWWWSWVSFIPAFVFLIWFAFSLGLLLYKRSWLLLVVSTIGLVFYSPRIDFGFAYQSAPEVVASTQNQISLFNWNTEYWADGNDVGKFIQTLVSADADIYHLHEAQHYGRTFADATGLLAGFFPGYKIYQSGEMVTLTRLPVVEVRELSNYLLRVDLQVEPNQVISFYNVHIPVHFIPSLLTNPIEFARDMQVRFEWRLEEYALLWDDIEDNGNEIVISGDFNTSRNMEEITPFYDQFKGAYFQNHTGVPATFSFGPIHLWRIDYVFGSERINFTSYDNYTYPDLSDHDVIEVTISY